MKLSDLLLRKSSWKISERISRNLEFSSRTAWGVLATMIVQHYWNWASAIAYLSPIIAVISSSLYFGLWQENALKVTYGTVIGGAIGTGIGYLYRQPYLVFILIFLSSAWIGTLPGWDRLTKVMSTLGLLLGSVLPVTTSGAIIGVSAYKNLLAVILMPIAIVGATLLFPKPAFAFFKLKSQISIISKKVSLMIKSIIKAFLSYDYLDLHCAEFNQLLLEVNNDLATLKLLNRYVISEQLIFQELQKVPQLVDSYINLIELIISELEGLRDMAKKIMYNKTQMYFVFKLEKTMIEMNDEMDIIIAIIGEYFDLFSVLPDFCKRIIHICYRFFYYVYSSIYQQLSPSTSKQKSAKSKGRESSSPRAQVSNHNFSKRYKPTKSLYGVPKSIEMVHSHKESHNFGQRHHHADSDPAGQLKPTSDEIDIETRDRSPSLTAYGFHSYNLTAQDTENQKSIYHNTDPIIEEFPANLETEESLNELFQGSDGYESRIALFDLMKKEYEDALRRLMSSRSELLFLFSEIRKSYILLNLQEIDGQPLKEQSSKIPTSDKTLNEINVLNRLKAEISLYKQHDDEINSLYEYDLPETDSVINAKKKSSIASIYDYERDEDEDMKLLHSTLEEQLANHQLLPLDVREEIIRLSLKNLGPRGAYFHRLSILVEYMISFRILFDENEQSIKQARRSFLILWKDYLFRYLTSIYDIFYLYANSIYQYVLGCFGMIHYLGLYLLQFYPVNQPSTRSMETNKVEKENAKNVLISENMTSLENGEKIIDDKEITSRVNLNQKQPQKYDIVPYIQEYFRKNIQSYKIGLAIALASILPIYRVLPRLFQGGFWATLVVALIRQENISSSFLMSYQRLEGTVIGCIFAFIMSQIFECNADNSNLFCIQQFGVKVIILILWLLACGLFREGEQHGYSATVAGFTPFIFIMNPVYLDLSAAWGRIEETFIGIVIYLVVDLCVFPQRIYPMMKTSVLNSIRSSRAIFQDSVKAVEILLRFEKIEVTEADSSSAPAPQRIVIPTIPEEKDDLVVSSSYASKDGAVFVFHGVQEH